MRLKLRDEWIGNTEVENTLKSEKSRLRMRSKLFLDRRVLRLRSRVVNYLFGSLTSHLLKVLFLSREEEKEFEGGMKF